MKKLIIATIFFSIFATSSFASNQAGKFYFEIGGGVTELKNDYLTMNNMQLFDIELHDGNPPHARFEKSAMIEGQIGYKISSNIAFGFALKHYFEANSYILSEEKLKNTKDLKKVILDEPGAHISRGISGASLNGYYDLYNMSQANIFLHAGTGINRIKFNSRIVDGSSRGEKKKELDYLTLSLKAGLGAGYALTSNVNIQIKYEYSLLDALVIKEIKGDLKGVKLSENGHAIIAGVRVTL